MLSLEPARVQDLTGREHSDSSPDGFLPSKRQTARLSRARHRPTRLEIRLSGFSRPAPRHGMMSWELPLSEMKGMRHSPLALGSPAGAPREKAADPEAQAGEKPVLQSRGRTTWPTFNKRTCGPGGGSPAKNLRVANFLDLRAD